MSTSKELNCWMGYSMVGPPFGDDDEFGPLFAMNCTGEGVKCISTNCIFDNKHSGTALRYHSCSRDEMLWCRAHQLHCEKMFNGTVSECANCAENLCNAENYANLAFSDKTVVGTAIGVLFLLGTLFYCLLRNRKTWQIHTLILLFFSTMLKL
ncbi:hypothetical protein niasHT_032417 [Heterodera trifolii]|uniref:Uncharacterized protein n=1 Tax=Heterodera trifolii TaxID=157864 RepID=A0ABD2HSF1_9BILA